ncbi:MAG: hypothetical protein IBX61_05375 [Thermoleophilia bacterium]|nr:hypothetical protein [Thermoleophilia bacterium]
MAKILALFAVSAMLVVSIMMLGGVALAIHGDAYIVGGLTTTPSSACIGDTVEFSGSGMPPNTPIAVFLFTEGEGAIIGLIGFTESDGAGNWVLSGVVPAMVERFDDGVSVPTPLGTIDVIAGTEEGTEVAFGTLTIMDCAAPAVTRLPSTGLPVAAGGLAGAGLLASIGLAIRVWRRRE